MNRKEEIKAMVKNAAAAHLSGDYKIFIFGSQAGLDNLIRADIDIGIDAGKMLDSKTFLKIYRAIDDLPTLYKFDLIDFYQADEAFKTIALKKIEFL